MAGPDILHGPKHAARNMAIATGAMLVAAALLTLTEELPQSTARADHPPLTYRTFVPGVTADSAPPPSPVVQSALAALAPPIREYITAQSWFADGIDEHEMLLLRFLGDATASTGSNYALPVTFVLGGPPKGFDLPRQMMVLDNHLYDYVTVAEKTVLIVVSAPAPLTQSQAAPTLAMAKQWLPSVADFAHVSFPFYYVHVEMNIADPSANYSRGANTELRAAFAAYAKSFCHESTHTMQYGKTYPTWFVEGSADLVAVHLTGVHNLAYPVTNEQIHLDLRASDQSSHTRESGNGYGMLQEIADIFGYSAMSDALGEILAGSRSGQAIVDILFAHTPTSQRSAVDGILRKWIADYPR